MVLSGEDFLYFLKRMKRNKFCRLYYNNREFVCNRVDDRYSWNVLDENSYILDSGYARTLNEVWENFKEN